MNIQTVEQFFFAFQSTMLQSARKMEIEQSLIINPMETVHIINDETTHVAAMPFVDGVSELFLIVPTNTPTDATDRMVPHSNLNIEGECKSNMAKMKRQLA